MKQLGKTRQLLLYAGPFPALAFFKIWVSSNAGAGPRSGSLTIVALLMLAFCAIVIVFAKRWDKPSYFDWTVGIYFALISLSLLIWPYAAGRFLSRYSVTGIYGCLFAAAFFPPVLGMEPFTCHYAKKYAPEAVWNNPVCTHQPDHDVRMGRNFCFLCRFESLSSSDHSSRYSSGHHSMCRFALQSSFSRLLFEALRPSSSQGNERDCPGGKRGQENRPAFRTSS